MTDFAFSPHDDGVIASGSQDGSVKVTIITILIILIIFVIMTKIIQIIATLPGFSCSVRSVQWEPDGEVDGHPPDFTSWVTAQNWDGDDDGDQDDGDDNDNNLGIYRFLGTQLQTWCLLLPAGENFPQISQKQETIW